MENEKHSYPVTILESHLDTFGHVNNATYLVLFEEARWDLITANGYGLAKIEETKLGPIILGVTIKFRRELRLRQKVVIETQLQSYKKKIATIYQEIKNPGGQTHCFAEFKFALFDMQNRKLVESTPEWLKAIGKHQDA